MPPRAGRRPFPPAIGVALALLLVVALAALWFQNVAGDAVRWRAHSLRVRLELAELRNDVLELSRAVRGYVASGREDWLEPGLQAQHRAPQRLQRLQALTADNAAQQQRLTALEQHLRALIALDEEVLHAAVVQGLPAARERIATGTAPAELAAMRTLLEALDAQELRLLHERDAAVQRNTSLTTAVTTLGSLLSLGLVAWAGWGQQRSLYRLGNTVRALELAQGSLSQANARLQAQAGQLAELNEALWRSIGDGVVRPSAAPMPQRLDGAERLEALRRTQLMDTAPEEDFDRYTRLAALTLQAPLCLISLVDERRQFFKSAFGLAEPLASTREAPVQASFCQFVVGSGAALVVSDAQAHPPAQYTLPVPEGVGAYLGVPLATPDGHVLGSLCVVDDKPRQWTALERSTLERIAQSVLAAIAVRMQLRTLEHHVAERTTEVRLGEERLRLALEAARMGAYDFDPATGAVQRIGSLYAALGLAAQGGGPEFMERVHPEDRERVRAHMAGVSPAQPSYAAEYRLRKASGEWAWIADHAQASFNGNGTLLRQIGINLDVTARREAEAALQEALAEKEVLLQEVHHRVKNNLQVVSSLLQLQRRQLQEPAIQAVFSETEHRVRAMALVHQRLYQQSTLSALNFGDYMRTLAEQLIRSFGAERRVRAACELQPLQLPVNAAVPLGLIVTELITNALKYAYGPGCEGVLRLVLRPHGEAGRPPQHLLLEVQDDGPGMPPDFDLADATSLGMRLVTLLSRQLDAAAVLEPGPGTHWRVTVPLEEVQASRPAAVSPAMA